MLICDASGLLAYFDASDAHWTQVSAVIEADPGPFVVSPYVVAEFDYLLSTRRGIDAEVSALTELSGGAWKLASFDADDLRSARDVIDRYRDQDIGVADARRWSSLPNATGPIVCSRWTSPLSRHPHESGKALHGAARRTVTFNFVHQVRRLFTRWVAARAWAAGGRRATSRPRPPLVAGQGGSPTDSPRARSQGRKGHRGGSYFATSR
jgi:predicted nucleic acid-binding protein